MTAAMLVTLPVAPVAAADPAVVFDKSVPETSLAGEEITYTLKVTNPVGGTVPATVYNVGFRDELPAGVVYVENSAGAMGEPRTSTNTGTGRQTLVWEEVSDLAEGETRTFTFRVTTDATTPDVTRNPVGTQITNSASVYGHTDARRTPKFDSGLQYVAQSAAVVESDSASTTLTALKVTKSEPNPESELLRGVHAHPTTYTLKVKNTGRERTENVVVTDYLPAELEFLGCGTVDNSAAGTREYDSAPRLDAMADLTTDCLTPVSVETVLDPSGLAAGVYTQVTWNLSTLTAGAEETIVYAAGVPQRENVMVFPHGKPSAESRGQAANLDNNTGPSTRERKPENSITNVVRAKGDYRGDLAQGVTAEVSDTERHTVTVEDVAVVKSSGEKEFRAAGTITYTLKVRVSEYVDASDIVLTDSLPDGMCYLSDTGVCATTATGMAAVTGARLHSLRRQGGMDSIVFAPLDVDANDTVTITYQARMRPDYGNLNVPTVSGDAFTNTVALTAKTRAPERVGSPEDRAEVEVEDDSSYTIDSDQPTLKKTIQPDVAAGQTISCSTNGSDYFDPAVRSADYDFNLGSKVCFRIVVTLSPHNQTRNATLTDYLPPNTTFDPASVVNAGTVSVSAADYDEDRRAVTWKIGGSAEPRFAAAGGVVDVRFSVRVMGAPTDQESSEPVDKTENLAKLSWYNTQGRGQSLRDQVTFGVVKPARAVIEKTARTTPQGATIAQNGAVKADQKVAYTVKVTNASDQVQKKFEVWDVLPAGIVCSGVSDISDAGICRNPADSGYPALAAAASAGRSVVLWTGLRSDAAGLAPRQSLSLTLTVTIPQSSSHSVSWVNGAAVRSFVAVNNTGQEMTHVPGANVGSGAVVVPPGDGGTVVAPQAYSAHTVATAKATVTKEVETSITESGNSDAQAVNGERLTWTITATVPADTNLYSGLITDALPSGLLLATDSVGRDIKVFSRIGTAPFAPMPGATIAYAPFTRELVVGVHDREISAGDTQAAEYRIVVQTKVAPEYTGDHNSNLKNSVSFTSKSTKARSGPDLSATDSRTVKYVVPSPSITKSNDKSTSTVNATSVITYTLGAANVRSRPTLHDAVVYDCLPAGLRFDPAGTAVTTTTDAGHGCAAGTTALKWSVGSLAGGSSQQVTYKASVESVASGAQVLTNTAKITGSTLANGSNDATVERVVTPAVVRSTVTVESARIVKTTSTPTRAPGERAAYSTAVTLPAQVNFWDATVLDDLPAALDAGSLVTTGVTCERAGVPCAIHATTDGSQGALTANGQRVGWFLGDISSDTVDRLVTISYTAVVKSAGSSNPARGDVAANKAWIKWNQANGANPTGVGHAFTMPTTEIASSVNVRVTEPALTVAKTVSTRTPGPGDTFTYTVKITNGTSATHHSAAYAINVSDCVPAGVVVDASSVTAQAGIFTSSAAGCAGGKITWNIAGPLGAGDSVTRTYTATLASPVVTGGATGLVNTAKIDAYSSLPAGGGRVYGPQSATATVKPALPQVNISKSAEKAVTSIGEDLLWTITARNDGGAPAREVTVTDVLPANWVYKADSARVSVAGGASVALEPTVTTDATTKVQTLVWGPAAQTLAPSRSVVITLRATPQSGVTTAPGVGLAKQHVNTAGVTAEDAEGATGYKVAPGDTTTTKYTGADATASTAIASADLRIVKSSTATPVAGRDFEWSIVVDNIGPDPAQGPIVVTDTLPSGATFVSASGSATGWTFTQSSGVVTATHAGPLAKDAALPTITLRAALSQSLAVDAERTNTATVSAPTHDPVMGNNTSSHTVTLTRVSDLKVAKAVKAGTSVVAGETATWEVTVSNDGPSDAQGPTTVTETLPAGLVGASATGTGWTCGEPASGTITCTTNTTIVAGGSSVLTVTGKVPSGQAAAVVNGAAVGGPNSDPTPTNNSASVTTPPDTKADVAITKRQVTTKLVPGKPVEYQLTVLNNGPSDAKAVIVEDVLDSDLTYVSSSTSAGNCAATGQSVTCALGAVEFGDSETITIIAALSPDFTGVLSNTATVSTRTTDPVNTNNTATVTSATAEKEVDLTLVKRHTGAARVKAGENTTFSLTVSNEGPSRSVGQVTVTDLLPAGVEYVSATGSGWSITETNGTVTASSTADIPRGASAPVITLTVKVLSNAGPATLSNTAVVSGTEFDPDLLNNTDDADITVVDDAELTLVKTSAASGPVVAGDEVEFTLVVSNAGPSDADDVAVVDTLPSGMTLVRASGPGWDCDIVPGTCSRPVLGAGTTSTITVVAEVASGVEDGETLVNTAVVSTTTAGDDATDNTDTADVDVIARADLGVVKKYVGDSAVAGETTTFEVKVTNHGLSDAVGPITLTDVLPQGMTFSKATSAGNVWSCDASDPSEPVCTTTAGLVAGATSEVLTIEVAIADDQPAGVVTNEVSVVSKTVDPQPGNDSDTADAEVTRLADLAILKSHTGSTLVGDEVTFTLEVSNAGPSTATGVTVIDEMPRGLELVSVAGAAASSDWTCATVDGDARCVLAGALAVGKTAELITVVATVTARAYPGVTNVASVSANEKDPEKENNSASDKVTVPAKVDLSLTKKLRGSLEVGTDAVYELTVTNEGPTADPSRITVTDVLPEGLTFVETTNEDVLCSAADSVLTCVVPSLDVDQHITVPVVVAVGAQAYPSVTNIARVTSGSTDTDPTNNTDSVTSVVPAKVDLVISKKSKGKFVVGEQGTYVITVTNRGFTAEPESIVVTDVLPKGLTLVEASGAELTCEESSGRVRCSIDGLGAGETRTLTLVVEIGRKAFPEITNTATISTSSVDTDLENNTSVDVKKVASSTSVKGSGEGADGPGGAGASGSSGTGSGGSSGGDGFLPNAGGPALGWAVLALLMVGGGAFLLRRRRA